MNNIFAATILIRLLLIGRSYGDSLQRLTTALQKNPRRLIEISFTDKYCVNYAPNNEYDFLTPFSGEYTYKGIENHQPSYELSKCQYDDNCRNGAILQVNSYGNWAFMFYNDNGDPKCNDVTSKPEECTNWWGGRNPQISVCGNQRTDENGESQAEFDARKACTDFSNSGEFEQPPYCPLTQSDKNELLRQYNVQRAIYGQPDFIWSTTLESEATISADTCGGNHCWAGDETALAQGIGQSDNVYKLLWDGYKNVAYKNGECNGNLGLVWGFMQDGHGNPMRGEDEIKYTQVGCAYNCDWIYCNYGV